MTLASLGLGWAGEDTLYWILAGLFHPGIRRSPPNFSTACVSLLSFLMISYFHVVLGEVVPKNLAIAKADRLAALVAPPLLLFYRATLAFVVIIERSADAITRALHLKGAGTAADTPPRN